MQAAEHYYVDAGDWDSAVNMYRGNNNWEEAYNCARDNGGTPAGNKVAYAWALTLGGEAGSKLLTRLVGPSLFLCHGASAAFVEPCPFLPSISCTCMRTHPFGLRLLMQGLVSEAIAYAMETSNFEHAFALARSNMKVRPGLCMGWVFFL